MNEMMRKLERSLDTINAGIENTDYAMVMVGAKEIAERSMPSWIDRIRIFAKLGSDLPAFKEADAEMRRLAIKVAVSAGRHDLVASQQAAAQLRQKCITCHARRKQQQTHNPNESKDQH